jgi:hypothetical protein
MVRVKRYAVDQGATSRYKSRLVIYPCNFPSSKGLFFLGVFGNPENDPFGVDLESTLELRRH